MTEAIIGHNIQPDVEKLSTIIDRIMRLEYVRRDAASDVKEIYEEAKSIGLDAYAVRSIIKIKLRDDKAAKRAKERAEICAVYSVALQLDLAL